MRIGLGRKAGRAMRYAERTSVKASQIASGAATPRARGFVAVLTVVLLFAATGGAAGATATTVRESVGSNGGQANSFGADPAISADGRFVAFISGASNLVPGDTNGAIDVFVRDRQAGTTSRVSVPTGGGQANDFSDVPAISADGRFVAFISAASNLVPGDTNGVFDVFVRDRQAATTSRVSVASGGGPANGTSFNPSISADGRFVAFSSAASNLVAGDSNDSNDVFVFDRQTATTTMVSVRSNGGQANNGSSTPSISGDGGSVAFVSVASNLVSGDTNRMADVFVHDRQSGTTSRVSVSSDGHQAAKRRSDSPSISADGRFVAFVSLASNLVADDTFGKADVFVHDRQTGATSMVSLRTNGAQVDWPSLDPSISADGRYVAFRSGAAKLVAGDTNGKPDEFVHDRQTGTTSRVSVRTNGGQANGNSDVASISADGRFVAFDSFASNLVAGDTNGVSDVFVRGPLY
jgi:Tol biopolymer transport system component